MFWCFLNFFVLLPVHVASFWHFLLFACVQSHFWDCETQNQYTVSWKKITNIIKMSAVSLHLFQLNSSKAIAEPWHSKARCQCLNTKMFYLLLVLSLICYNLILWRFVIMANSWSHPYAGHCPLTEVYLKCTL